MASLRHKEQDDREAHPPAEVQRGGSSPPAKHHGALEKKSHPLQHFPRKETKACILFVETRPQARIKKKIHSDLAVVVRACNPSTGNAEAGGLLLVQDQPKIHSQD